jgi:hypothetical protein
VVFFTAVAFFLATVFVAVRVADEAAVVPLRAVTLVGLAMLTYSWIVSSWLDWDRTSGAGRRRGSGPEGAGL